MIGTMFPNTHIGKTLEMGNPIQIPTGIAPRNSTTGIAEIVARTAHFGNPNDMKYLAIFWPICKCSSAAALAANAGDWNAVKVHRAKAIPVTIGLTFVHVPRFSSPLRFFWTVTFPNGLVHAIESWVGEGLAPNVTWFLGTDTLWWCQKSSGSIESETWALWWQCQ